MYELPADGFRTRVQFPPPPPILYYLIFIRFRGYTDKIFKGLSYASSCDNALKPGYHGLLLHRGHGGGSFPRCPFAWSTRKRGMHLRKTRSH